MSPDDENFIPGFARNRQLKEGKTQAGLHVKDPPSTPRPAGKPGAQRSTIEKNIDDIIEKTTLPAKKKTAAVKRDTSALIAERYQKAKADLEKWQKRQRFANNKVAALQLTIKRYEKKGVS